MLIKAILVGLFYWLYKWPLGYISIMPGAYSPMFLSVFLGIIVGDVQQAVIVGAFIEAVYLGLITNPNLAFAFQTAEYQEAARHFSQQAGADIDSHMIRANAEKLIYCHQNQKDLLDFDFWCQYESILKEPITWDEYSYIDSQYEGDILEIGDASEELVASLKTHLDSLRRNHGITAEPSDKSSSLDHRISGAKERQLNTSATDIQRRDVDIDRS